MFELVGTSLNVGAWQFLTIFLLVFALFMILAGVFTAYFGSGKSRTVGIGLLVAGIVVGLLSAYAYHTGWFGSGNKGELGSLIWEAFLVIVAAVIGALVAVGIFLVAIMKS
jgi:FtsH-binding integral membrane protein